VHRRAGAAELVPFGGEAHELDLASEQQQRREEVLGLLDVAAEVVLRVEDEEWCRVRDRPCPRADRRRSGSTLWPTALDNGRRSPPKLVGAVVARLLGRKG
jgi:hypothetical protein